MKARAARAPRKRVFIISGISGAGKSQALKVFQDLGFYCVDNLPMALLPQFVELLENTEGLEEVALGMDVRMGEFLKVFDGAVALLKDRGLECTVLFLDASDEVLVQRFSETRHRHPLGGQLAAAIGEERRRLREVKGRADKVIDTSNMTLGELKEKVSQALGLKRSQEMNISVTSFGFKRGLPMDADLVLDVRFLPNPHYVPALKPQTGLDAPVRRFLAGKPGARRFVERLVGLLQDLLPRYVKEGKSYLTVAIGCTGGRHRSVYVAHEVAGRLKKLGYPVREFHRDMGRARA